MKKKIKPVIIIIALIILFGLIYAAQIMLERFSYTKNQTDFGEYYGLQATEDVAIIYNNEILEAKGKCIDGVFYMDYDSVKEYVCKRLYYGERDGVLLYTTPNTTYTASVGGYSWSSGSGESGETPFVISYIEGDKLYVSLEYAARFSDSYCQCFTEPNRIQLLSGNMEAGIAKLKKTTPIRVRGGRKSEVVANVDAGPVIVVEAMDEWSKVVTWNGHIGYVENKNLDVSEENTLISKDLWESEVAQSSLFEPISADGAMPSPSDLGAYTSLSFEGKLNVGFHSVGSVLGADSAEGVISRAKTLNVIAPTWFAINDNVGNIRSLASSDYVTQAHANNVQVWAALDDFNSENDVDAKEVFTSSAARATLINGLMEQVATYGIDGISVDVENVTKDYIDSYLQFLRELSVVCRANSIYLSVCNYVPMDFNDYYDLKEQGTLADYVIIMGYDEHYGGSSEPGSVASIGYVENGIQNALQDVPAEKLINAIPFYTRVWMTSGGEVTSKALHMDGALNIIEQKGIPMNWDEETCQYYGEVTDEDGVLYQIWNEDARSIEIKLSVMQSAGIAGVAEWALSFETADVWDVIAAYMGQ